MNQKPPKCTCTPKVFAFLSKPERTYYSLTPQLSQKYLLCKCKSLRGNPQLLHGAIYLPLQNGTKGFYSAQTSYLNMEVVTLAKDDKPLLTWVMKC